jgi:hypothetical protein
MKVELPGKTEAKEINRGRFCSDVWLGPVWGVKKTGRVEGDGKR